MISDTSNDIKKLTKEVIQPIMPALANLSIFNKVSTGHSENLKPYSIVFKSDNYKKELIWSKDDNGYVLNFYQKGYKPEDNMHAVFKVEVENDKLNHIYPERLCKDCDEYIAKTEIDLIDDLPNNMEEYLPIVNNWFNTTE